MLIWLGVLVGLIILTILIVLHEGGHFVMARRNGVKVNEFGIGFPPRAIAWVKGEDGKWHRLPRSEWGDKTQKGLVFSLNWLPIGGFCAMDGESDADTRKGTFGAATFWQKTKILFGGVLMNWLTAAVILTILAATGMPRVMDGQFMVDGTVVEPDTPMLEITKVEKDSPAEKAGMEKGMKIVSARTEDAEMKVADYPKTLIEFNKKHAGEAVYYEVETEDGERLEEPMKIELNPADSDYQLGVGVDIYQQLYRSPLVAAPLVGVVTTVQLTGETFRGVGKLIVDTAKGIASQLSPNDEVREKGQASLEEAGNSVAGPIGILGQLFPSVLDEGVTNIAFLTAIISISLACMNVLPIPALDGGRWLLIALFKLRKKPLTTETEGRIVSRAFLVLIAIAILVTVLDVMRIVG